MNVITVVGRMASDPTMAGTDGNPMCNFRVASDNTRKKADGSGYETNFYNCTAFGRTADTVCKYVKKGHRIALSGDLVIRQYKDSNGNDRTSVDITCRSVDLIQPRDGNTEYPKAPVVSRASDFTPVETDELPF